MIRLAWPILVSALVLSACSVGTTPVPVTSDQPAAGDPSTSATPVPVTSGQPAAGDPSVNALLEHELTDVRSGERFTLGQLAADGPVLVETMAIWCTTCLAQQREVVEAHALADFHSVGLDVDPNERPEDLAEYAEREGFDWRFAMADATLVDLLTDAYGFAVTNPPSTPTFVVSPDGQVSALEFGRVRSAEELVAELASN
jgi:thiol-disulfide isomerase/thioredoxin